MQPRQCMKWCFGLSAIGLALLLGCRQPNAYKPPPPPKVTVARPIQKSVVTYLEETGTTEAVEMVQIRARVSGFLEQVEFEPGAMVEANEVLYRIQRREFESKVKAAQADLEAKKVDLTRAEIELKRQQKLFAENATAETTLVAAKADRDAAIAAVDASDAVLDRDKLDLEYTVVTTPIAGRVGKTLVKSGNLVGDAEATHLTTVISYDPIYVNFNINENDLLDLLARGPRDKEASAKQEDIKVFLSRANDEGFPFEGHLNYTDLAVAQSTGTFAARGIISNPDRKILPGMFVQIRIPIGSNDNAILVPERAVGADQMGRYVLTVGPDNVVERHNVRVGVKEGQMIVITKGEKADDVAVKADAWVIVNGIQRARTGAKVDPQQTTLKSGEAQSPSPTTGVSTVQVQARRRPGGC